MERISLDEFRIWQPSFPTEEVTDKYYLGIANKLLDIYVASGILKEIPERLVKRMCLCITGYFQDIVADAGIWRSFVDACRKLYGYSVPFHEEGEKYVDYELNIEDIRFLTWYSLAMVFEDMRDLYPHDSRILDLAEKWFGFLAEVYDDAPVPEGYNISRGLEFHDPEDSEKIYHLGHWLFLHCYLMTPAFALTLSQIMADPELMKSQDITLLQNRIEQSMMEDPTGPLSLFIPEWLQLIIEGKMPKERVDDNNKDRHPYYLKFTEATGGKELKYFGDYQEMNRFFIEKMGWDKDQEHLPMMKSERDFVIMVNPTRGMLVARNVARCIADPENPYYDKEYAQKNAIDLLTVRGRCPADLVKYACKHGWLPDAMFPESDDHMLVETNWDFIARCYLQQYYRD